MHVARLPLARVAAKHEVHAALRVINKLVCVTQAWRLCARGSDLLNLPPAHKDSFTCQHTRQVSGHTYHSPDDKLYSQSSLTSPAAWTGSWSTLVIPCKGHHRREHSAQ